MHRTSKGGTYRLDRRFPGVGRIAVASGATTRDEFRNRNAMLTRLYNKGRLDLLTEIRAGRLTVTEVYAADRNDNLDRLTGDRAVLVRPLWKAVEGWNEHSAKAQGTRRRYETSFDALKATAVLGDGATIEDLGGVDWRQLEAAWKGGAADWNHLRRAVSRFLSMQLGDVYHPVPPARRSKVSRNGRNARECRTCRPPCSGQS